MSICHCCNRRVGTYFNSERLWQFDDRTIFQFRNLKLLFLILQIKLNQPDFVLLLHFHQKCILFRRSMPRENYEETADPKPESQTSAGARHHFCQTNNLSFFRPVDQAHLVHNFASSNEYWSMFSKRKTSGDVRFLPDIFLGVLALE